MAIVGLFTNSGIAKSIDASNDLGFQIIPTTFGVSRDAGALDPLRSQPNTGLWYQNPISTRVVVDSNTIKVVCTVPPGAVGAPDEIREIYIFAEDSNNDEFLLAFGQPTDVIIYDPAGTVTLELQLSIVDIDLTANYIFQNTKQTELDEHLTAPDAHIEYAEAMAKAGIFIPAGSFPASFVGQSFIEGANFDGNAANTSREGVVFTARLNGDELNGEVISFDGIRGLDEIVTEFNNAHPKDPIDHNGLPNQILGVGTATLSGGSYAVDELDLVYYDPNDEVFKAAIADGTDAGQVLGAAYRADKMVRGLGGFISITTGFPINDDLYLSDTDAGKITNVSTAVKVGIQANTDFILLGAFGGGGAGGSGAGYDAIVSDTVGFARYPTLQQAIDIVPNNGFILVEKMEDLRSRIRTNGKTVNVVFRGHATGLQRFLGQNEIQKILFDNVPDGGTWRIEFTELYTNKIWQTNDLPFNANATLIETELNNLPGHNGVSVSGNYVDGFTLTFNDYIDLPLVTFSDAGLNEIQRFNFSDVPTDGTCDFEFEGNSGDNHAFNDTPAQLFQVLFPIPGINDIDIRGSFNDKFYEIEFKGVDGLEDKTPLYLINSNLNVGGSGGTGGTPVQVNGSLAFPVAAETVQEGRFPSNALLFGTNPVQISAIEIQKGIEVGPSKAVELDSDNNQFVGMGRLQDFNTGIDMSSFLGTRMEMYFDNIELPLDGKGQIIGRNFNFAGSIGFDTDSFDAKPVYEEPQGTIDGINADFELNGEPNTLDQFALIRDQLWLRPDWYTVVGTTITITNPSAIPVPGQDLLAWYTPDILDFTPDITYEPWFYETFDGLVDEFKIDLGNNYNRGSDRLEVYRNGLYMNLGTIVGDPVNRYQEFSVNEIGLSLHTQPSDIFASIFKDYRVLSRGDIINKGGQAVINVPNYAVGQNELRVWRNGVLMNAAGIGSPMHRYSETDSTTITLDVQAEPDDVFSFEISDFQGTRDDVDGMNNTPNVILTNSIQSGKVMVYRNGVLIYDSNTLGDPIDRYTVLNNFAIQLGENAQLTDWITVITVPL